MNINNKTMKLTQETHELQLFLEEADRNTDSMKWAKTQEEILEEMVEAFYEAVEEKSLARLL